MLEDYWLPRREGGRGTEVTTLAGGQTLGQMDDVLYFQKKFLQTLNVPVNRLNSDALFSLGRATEVTRDELKFARFISRLRGRFSTIFIKMLERQLVLKQIMTIEDFALIQQKIRFDFAKDNYFTELKDAEIIQNRSQLMMTLEQGGLLGKYYSYEWARRNILYQSEEDIEQQDEQITEEQNDPRWNPPPMGPDGMPMEQPGGVQPLASDEDAAESPANDDKDKKVRDAETTVKLLGKKKDRSIQDEAKYRSAIQILSRNK